MFNFVHFSSVRLSPRNVYETECWKSKTDSLLHDDFFFNENKCEYLFLFLLMKIET